MNSRHSNVTWTGVASAFCAFLIWGLSPIFYKALSTVPPFEILMHRMVWSFIFLLPLLVMLHRWKTFIAVFRNLRTLGMLATTTLLVSCNWFVFIWAINNGHILQTSLGYYINPLVNVLLAMVFLGERDSHFRLKDELAKITAERLADLRKPRLDLMEGQAVV